VTAHVDDLRSRLETIAEELADLALARLREALDGDDASRAEAAADERRLTRARRSVEKAATLLQSPNGSD
jgi:hypothetical protein